MELVSRARRRILHHILQAAALLAAAFPAFAQEGKPIEWVVGYAVGGGSDAVARSVAEELRKSLGRTVIVNNKPGAATNIAAEYVAKSKDIGNVMLTADFATLAANPALFAKLPYDAERDFAPIGLLARFPLLLVVAPQVQAKDFKEFAAWARTQAGGVSYGSAGIGSPHHLAGELLRERSGLKLQHVAYRGAAPAVQDLIGGQIPVALMDTASVQQYITSGKLRAIGVASPKRLAAFPEVPDAGRAGSRRLRGLRVAGPRRSGGDAARDGGRTSKALQQALESTAVKARFQALSLEAMPGTPQDMAAYAKGERERWGKLIRDNGIKLD